MTTMLLSNRTSCGPCSCSPRVTQANATFSGLSLSRPAMTRPASRLQPVASFSGGMSPLETVKIISQLVTVGTLGVGAWMLLGREPQVEQDQQEQPGACPKCGGSGFEPCMCRRWSDGDVGCSSCNKTGYCKCKSCGGGGRAVPVYVEIRRD